MNQKITFTRHIKDFTLITAGIFPAAFGFKGFLMTNHFIDGGATGISLLISPLTPIPFKIPQTLNYQRDSPMKNCCAAIPHMVF